MLYFNKHVELIKFEDFLLIYKKLVNKRYYAQNFKKFLIVNYKKNFLEMNTNSTYAHILLKEASEKYAEINN